MSDPLPLAVGKTEQEGNCPLADGYTEYIINKYEHVLVGEGPCI